MRWSIEVTAVEGDERLLRDVLASLDLSLIEKEGFSTWLGRRSSLATRLWRSTRKRRSSVEASPKRVSTTSP